jgi:hypothetical protein
MYTEIFYYDEYYERYTSIDYLIASVNPTEICYIFEKNNNGRKVTAIETTDGKMYYRTGNGWTIKDN